MPDKPDAKHAAVKHAPAASGIPKVHSPSHMGGSSVQNAEGWGGSKGPKGQTLAHRRNPNSSAKP